MDFLGLVSTIERDSVTGIITAIISPKGERTEFADSLGMFKSVTNPNGEQIRFVYTEGGLLSKFILPEGGEQVMQYDSTGKLISASTAETPVMQLDKTQTQDGYQISSNSPTGLNTTMQMRQTPNGPQYLTGIDGLGRTTTATLHPSGKDTLRTPDGTLIIQELSYTDQRFGTQTPIPAKTTVRTPSGLTSVQTQTRVQSFSGSLVSVQRDSTNINGRGWSSVWALSNRSITETTPENRKTFSFLNTMDQVTKDSTQGITATSYTYDTEGRVTSVTQGTRVTTYTYDSKGRLQTMTDPTGRTDSLFYDDAGRVTRQVFDDGRWAEKRIGRERSKTKYPFRSFLRNKVRMTFGSDWTVAPLSPILGIYAAVTRRTTDGANPDGWIPEQKVTVEDAIRAYTIESAFAAFEENEKGSIAPGKLADFVVLSEDIMSGDPLRIEKVRVEMTILGGKIVHKKP